MTPEIETLVRKQLALFTALRSLGFTNEQIFVAFYNGGEVFTELRADDRVFRANFPGSPKVVTAEYVKAWEAACEEWNARLTADERHKIFTTYMTHDALFALAASIARKGITVPKLPDMNVLVSAGEIQ
jgi:selenocysteine lyase/cysteine desulfurase